MIAPTVLVRVSNRPTNQNLKPRNKKEEHIVFLFFHVETGIDSRLWARSLRVLTVHRTVIHYAPLQFPPYPRPTKKRNTMCSSFLLVRETGIEPVRFSPHAPQTCASASSATPACRRDCDNVTIIHFFSRLSTPFLKFFLFFFCSPPFFTQVQRIFTHFQRIRKTTCFFVTVVVYCSKYVILEA